MAKKSVKRPKSLPALTPRGMQLVSFVVNAAALGSHSSDCDLESMSAKLETTPGRLRPMLRKLEAQGWLTIEGVAEYVYPTVAAIRRLNPNIEQADAERRLR